MGSTGTNTFSDYPGSGGGPKQGTRTGGTKTGDCPNTIPEVSLEEVSTSEYFEHHKDLPHIGTTVHVQDKRHGGRLAVIADDTGQIVGLLPTRLNYLFACIQKGHSYRGEVVDAGTMPIPRLSVELHNA